VPCFQYKNVTFVEVETYGTVSQMLQAYHSKRGKRPFRMP